MIFSPKLKSLLKRLTVVTVTLVVIVFVMNVLADNPYSHRIAREVINEKVTSETNIILDFQAIKISVLPFGVDLYGLSVSPQDRTEENLFKASQVKARVSMWSLIIGEPRLGLVEIYDPEVTFPFPESFTGIFKEESSTGKDSEPIKWPLDIEEIPLDTISLRNARIYVELEDEEDPDVPLLRTSVTGLDLTANISDLSEIELYILAKSIDLEATGKPVLKGTEFETDIIISDKKIHRSPYRILAENLDFGGILSGTFDRDASNILEAIDINAEFEGKGDMAQLGQVFDIPDTAGGVEGQGKADLTIPVESKGETGLLIVADAKSNDAKIKNFRLFNTEAHVEIDLDQLHVTDAIVKVGDNEYGTASGTIGFDKAIPIDFKAKPNGLPLTDLLSALTVDFDVIESGVTSNNLAVKGVGDPLRLKVSAIADFDNLHNPSLRRPEPDNPDFPTCRFEVNLDINSEQVNFDKSHGSCFVHAPTSKKGIVPDLSPTPPLDALHITPFIFSGFASYEEKRGMDLAVSSAALKAPIANEISGIALEGEGSLDTRVYGPYTDVKVSNDIRTTDLVVMGIPFGRSSGIVNIIEQGKVIQWQDVRSIFKNNGSIFSESGQLDPDSLEIAYKLNVADLPKETIEKIFLAADLPGHSFALHSLDIDAKGQLLQPGSYVGNLDFYIKEMKAADLARFDVISGKIALTEDEIKTDNLQFELQDFQLRNEITITRNKSRRPNPQSDSILEKIGINRDAKVKIKSETYVSDKWKKARTDESFFFDHLQNLPLLRDYATTAKIQGRLSMSANLEGSFEQVEGSFQAQTTKTVFMGSAIAPVGVEGIIAGNKLDLTANQSGNALEGRISIDLNDERLPYSWYFNANRFDLRALGSQFFAKDPRNFAYFSGEWTMKGELTDWWHSEGELAVNDVRVRYYRDVRGESKVLELKDERPVKVLFRKDGWRFADNQELLLDSDRFRLHLSLGNSKPPERFNISYDGYFDLILLQNMSQVIETASGLVEFQGQITGSVEDPEVTFNIRNKADKGDSITVGIGAIRPPFTDVNFDASYIDNKFVINSLTAKKGSGTITASGQTVISDANIEESRIDITLDQATIVYQLAILKSFEMELSGSLAISGNKAPFDISGDIVVDRARSTREFDLREQIIGALQRRELDTPLVPEDPLANLDLRITADNSIEIYNRTIQSVLSANLVIKGTNVLPVINGQIEVNKGSFAYKYRRDFRITQGLITFDDPVKPDPRLDILGVSEISGYRVYLAITGRASNPKIDLSVDPPSREDGTPLTKLDILVLMSTGSLPERTQNNSAASAAQAEALNILVGQFEEPVEKLFDLSGQKVVQRVYIDTYAGEDGPTPRLNLPLNLHRDWDVIFRVDENNQKVSLGYTINESISISGSVDSQRENQNTRINRSEATQNGPDTGVDLKFRFAFP